MNQLISVGVAKISKSTTDELKGYHYLDIEQTKDLYDLFKQIVKREEIYDGVLLDDDSFEQARLIKSSRKVYSVPKGSWNHPTLCNSMRIIYKKKGGYLIICLC